MMMRQKKILKIASSFTALLLIVLPITVVFADEKKDPEMSPVAHRVEHNSKLFRPSPQYAKQVYDRKAQEVIYGGKYKVRTARPLFELGRRLYLDGPVPASKPIFGEKNRDAFWFMGFGDWRVGLGYNDFDNGNRFGRLAAQINLDFDARITATERLHAKMTPIDENGRFTRVDFAIPGKDSDSTFVRDPDLDNVFFEGDFGPIFAGISGHDNAIDLPFSVGLIPLFTQNGIWLNDAFTGFAITPWSAKNSKKLDISNFDISFFAGFDRISTGAFKNVPDAEDRTDMFGMYGFAEANRGYWEWGYGYLKTDFDGGDYHNFSIAHTRRWRHKLSNSFRLIANAGQKGILVNPLLNIRQKTANGVLLLIENSLITHKPSTLIPYFNFFAGFDRPQPIARAAGAGGVLLNTGLNFEGDALTGLPLLDANANNTVGGAIGLEYLFNLNQQLVFEIATVIPHGDASDRTVKGNQYGFDTRFQRPFYNAWIVRFDGMVGRLEKASLAGNRTIWGVRSELRRKF